MKHSELSKLSFTGPLPGQAPLLNPSGSIPLPYSSNAFHYWDPWFVSSAEKLHLFHLQADKRIPALERHHHASIGHAILGADGSYLSLPPALSPDEEVRTIWTGSSLQSSEGLNLFYTFRRRDENLRQRIGFARSTDSTKFESLDIDGVVLPDEKFYKDGSDRNNYGVVPAWRDPFVFFDDKEQCYRMLVTAQDSTVSGQFDACIGQATSRDLVTWRQSEPLLSPQLFAEMEHPQLIVWNGMFYLLFSCKGEYCSFSGQQELRFSQPFCYVSDSSRGPFLPIRGQGLINSLPEDVFGIRVLACSEDYLLVVGWLSGREDESFIGEITSPFLIRRESESLIYEPLERH